MLALALALALLAPEAPVTEAEVRPFFDAGPFSSAVPAIRAGKAEEVAGALDGREEPEARYLRGRALVQLGRGPEALAALAGVASALPDIGDRVHALCAQAAELAGSSAEAAGDWERVPEGSLLFAEARLALARLQVAAGRPADAVALLRPLLGGSAPPDLSRPDAASRALLFAGRALAQPDPAGARRFLVDCWSRHPLAPEAPECRANLDALKAPHGAPPGDEDSLRRAEALLEWNRNESALAEVRQLEKRFPPGSDEGCRALFVRGKAFRKLRQYARAAELLAQVDESCGDPVLRAKSLYLLAVARANLDSREGIAAYLRFAREFPGHPQADDALYFAADLLARAGNVVEAQRVLRDLLRRYPEGDFRPEALFRSAWLARQQGDWSGAIGDLKRVEEEFRDADPYEHARAAYWRGRVLDQRRARGDRQEARATWSQLARRYPADYYGLLARGQLGQAGAAPGEVRIRASASGKQFRYRAGPLAGDRHFRAARTLLRLGLAREAVDELNAVDRKLLGIPGEWGTEPLLLLAELLDRAGDARSAHGLLRSQGRQLLRQPPTALALRIWEIAYPPAVRDEVLRWAKAADVPPDLLQALVREESALDPSVVSAAGAVGLTQLMVPTAARVARRIGLRPPTQVDLTDPVLNIRLGALHLGDLLRRFGGSVPLAIAAYNAGEGTVRAWWRSRAWLPLDEFVEDIPIQETRGYVKRVLRTYAAYRMLYGQTGEKPIRLSGRLPAPPGVPLHAEVPNP